MHLNNLLSVPSTSSRVPLHTTVASNERIRRATLARLQEIGMDRRKIDSRLEEIEREWDVERVLEANAATAVLIGLSLGATVNRKFFAFPAVVAGFLLLHAVRGWCPPVPVLRRMGVRTAREIEEERITLKARRGDLKHLEYSSGVEALSALDAS
jgi:hypothetical protein